jgi:hypothetical protein
VFRHERDIFMMPETQQSNRIEVWRATEFPFRWELCRTAFDGLWPADSNLFKVGDTWWLSTNLSDHDVMQDHNSELYLFKVDGPELRRITPHRRNPVMIGSSLARNAGPVVDWQGRLFRPSQINAYGVYGYGLNIMEIIELSDERYEERLVRRIVPDFRKDALAIHHISFAAGRFVIDWKGPRRRTEKVLESVPKKYGDRHAAGFCT